MSRESHSPGETVAPTEEARGIPCRKCGCRHHHVLQTRRLMRDRIGRQRECRHCGYRFWTYEKT